MAPEELPTIMMSVEKPDALAAAEIHAIRQLADAVTMQSRQFATNMEAQTKTLERLNDKLDKLSTDVTRLQEQRHGDDIKELKGELGGAFRRIDKLESDLDQAKGAATLWAWMSKNMPWLLPFLAAVGLVLADRIKK